MMMTDPDYSLPIGLAIIFIVAFILTVTGNLPDGV
jgi:hypothetical protein